MTLLTYEKLMRRFRHSMVASGVKPPTVTNAELYAMLKGATHEDRVHSLKVITGLVPERYWEAHGL